MTARSKRRLGLGLIIASVTVLLLLLPGYAIATFVVSQILASSEGGGFAMIGSMINVILGLSGVLALVGVPVGAVILARAGVDPKAGEHLKEQTGYGHLSVDHAAFLTQWSLGAFLNPVIWAFGNKLWPWALSLLAPVVITPILGLLWSVIGVIPVILVVLVMIVWSFFATIYLIVRGRRLAWKRGWVSFEAFQKRQRFLLWLIIILALVAFVISLVFGALYPETKEDLQDTSARQELILDSICDRYADVDGDYLTAADEKKYNTNPNSADTDGDGYDDLSELLGGYDAGTFDSTALTTAFSGRGATPDEIRENWMIAYTQKQEQCKD